MLPSSAEYQHSSRSFFCLTCDGYPTFDLVLKPVVGSAIQLLLGRSVGESVSNLCNPRISSFTVKHKQTMETMTYEHLRSILTQRSA